MDITLTINDDQKDRVITALSEQYGYKEKIEDDKGEIIDNPVSSGEFCRNIIKSFIKNVVIAYEANRAAESARKAAIANAEDIGVS